MKSKLIRDSGGDWTFALIFETDDAVMASSERSVGDHRIGAARFAAIGALSAANLGYFQRDEKRAIEIPVSGQVEVLSLIGDVALKDGKPSVQAQIVVGQSEGSTKGGHLFEGYVRPTLEPILVESPRHFRKEVDPESGMALIALDRPKTNDLEPLDIEL